MRLFLTRIPDKMFMAASNILSIWRLVAAGRLLKSNASVKSVFYSFLIIFGLEIYIIFRKRGWKVLQNTAIHGKLLTVENGWLTCPVCRRNKRLLRIPPDAQAHRVPVYCRSCKTEIIVDIEQGQSYESRSQ